MLKNLTKLVVTVATFCAMSCQLFAQGVTVIQGEGVATAINPFQFAGTGVARIGHDKVSESSLATLTSLNPGPGGSLVGTSTHTIQFGARGTITTTDELRLVPVNDQGLYVLSIKSAIVSGTGDFAGVNGELTFNGFANLATGQVTWKLHGQYR
ncbi:MAG: hypothetical protein JSS65_02450 [Armatimonadetes bacterium]|nr:hypothetical protein [Armatimonadota bacterium]